MSKENNIKKGLLSEKMSNYNVEPPEGAWESISSRLHSGSSRRYLFIALAAAAGLALAITVGVNLIDSSPELPIAENDTRESEVENDIHSLDTENNISAEIAEEALEAIPLQKDEVTDQKTESQAELKENRKRHTVLEEKVLIAMEEVIEEMENEEGIFLMEKIEGDQDAELVADHETEQGSETDGQTDEDAEQDELDHQTGIESEEEIMAQTINDSLASQHYLDSLTRMAVVDDEILPDGSKDKSRWQLGASLSPIYSYRDVYSPDIVQNQTANSSESGRLTYSGGVQVSYLSSERLSIESGLYYNKMGLNIDDFTRFESNLDFWVGANVFYDDNSIINLTNSIGTIDSKNEDVFMNSYVGKTHENRNWSESTDMLIEDEIVNSFEQSLEYIEIPFNIKYKVINRDFKVLLIGGVSTNLLVGSSVSANTSNGKIAYGSIQDIRTVNYSGNAGLGFVYSFSGNLSLSVEPRFRYYLNSINLENLPQTRPYVIGLYTGVNYTF